MTTPQHKDTTLDGYSKVLTTTHGGKEEVWVLFEDARANRDRAVVEAIQGVATRVLNKGENPAYHDRMMFEISQKAPLLYAEICGQVGHYKKLKETPNED